MTTKMTNLKAIAFVLENCELPTEVKEKLERIKASYAKKSTGERKPTAKQLVNEDLKRYILEYMQDNTLYSIGQLTKEVPELVSIEASPNKTSALIKQLKDAGLVIRVEEKRKAYFKLA